MRVAVAVGGCWWGRGWGLVARGRIGPPRGALRLPGSKFESASGLQFGRAVRWWVRGLELGAGWPPLVESESESRVTACSARGGGQEISLQFFG